MKNDIINILLSVIGCFLIYWLYDGKTAIMVFVVMFTYFRLTDKIDELKNKQNTK